MDTGNSGLSEDQRVGHYIEMWKQTVQVNQHFNEIEWRIRGLALTVATFALGAAGLAARDGAEVLGISLGTLVVGVGLVLWYAFYFVDRAWYHPLLKASVVHAESLEEAIKDTLPLAGLSQQITAGSPYAPNRLVKALSRTTDRMQSDNKLVWFYGVGAAALALVAVLLQIASLFDQPASSGDEPQEVEIHIDRGATR